jgi:hypothetical protein
MVQISLFCARFDASRSTDDLRQNGGSGAAAAVTPTWFN